MLVNHGVRRRPHGQQEGVVASNRRRDHEQQGVQVQVLCLEKSRKKNEFSRDFCLCTRIANMYRKLAFAKLCPRRARRSR